MPGICPNCGNPLPEDSSKCWFCSHESKPTYHKIKAILHARPGNVELVGSTEYACVTTHAEKVMPLINALIEREELPLTKLTVVIEMTENLGQPYTAQHWASFPEEAWFLIRRDHKTLINPIAIAVKV